MKHQVKPLAYMRYGDDWICFANNRQTVELIQTQATTFLNQELGLAVNPKIDIVSLASKGISYLGVDIWPSGRRLQPRVKSRITVRVNPQNIASYKSLVKTHDKAKRLKELNWSMLDDI